MGDTEHGAPSNADLEEPGDRDEDKGNMSEGNRPAGGDKAAHAGSVGPASRQDARAGHGRPRQARSLGWPSRLTTDARALAGAAVPLPPAILSP